MVRRTRADAGCDRRPQGVVCSRAELASSPRGMAGIDAMGAEVTKGRGSGQ